MRRWLLHRTHRPSLRWPSPSRSSSSSCALRQATPSPASPKIGRSVRHRSRISANGTASTDRSALSSRHFSAVCPGRPGDVDPVRPAGHDTDRRSPASDAASRRGGPAAQLRYRGLARRKAGSPTRRRDGPDPDGPFPRRLRDALVLARLVVAWLVGVKWHLLPAAGMEDPLLDPGAGPLVRMADVGRHLVLPALTLSVVSIAGTMRYQRSAMLEVLHLPYIVTARAKGLPDRRSPGATGGGTPFSRY